MIDTSAETYDRNLFNRRRAGRPMGAVWPKRSPQNSPRSNPCDFNTRNPQHPDSIAVCRRSRALFFSRIRPHHHHIQLYHHLVMTTATNVSTRPATISGLLTSAGQYIVNLASSQLDQAGPEVSELSFVLGGVNHRFLSIKIEPYRGKFSAVLPLTRSALVSWQEGNESHAQRLLAAVRSAMTDRDVTAADAAVRKIGAEGFSTEVVGA